MLSIYSVLFSTCKRILKTTEIELIVKTYEPFYSIWNKLKISKIGSDNIAVVLLRYNCRSAQWSTLTTELFVRPSCNRTGIEMWRHSVNTNNAMFPTFNKYSEGASLMSGYPLGLKWLPHETCLRWTLISRPAPLPELDASRLRPA